MRSPNEKGFEVTTPRSPNPNTHSPDFNNLPEWLQPSSALTAMKAARRWMLHHEKRPFYASGKPRSGTLDSPQDLAQLVSFTEAQAALAANPKFSGLGFALGHGWQGIDLTTWTQTSTCTNWRTTCPDTLKSRLQAKGFTLSALVATLPP